MARFIVRVELHGAESGDYVKLHSLMQNAGYSKKIQDVDFTWFEMPTAEYVFIGSTDVTSIRNHVMEIAKQVKNSYNVLVTEVANISWYLSRSKS